MQRFTFCSLRSGKLSGHFPRAASLFFFSQNHSYIYARKEALLTNHNRIDLPFLPDLLLSEEKGKLFEFLPLFTHFETGFLIFLVTITVECRIVYSEA